MAKRIKAGKEFLVLDALDPLSQALDDPEFRKLIEQDAELREAIDTLESLKSRIAEVLAKNPSHDFLASKGLPLPYIEGWEYLALTVGISFERVRSGKLTPQELHKAVKAFVQKAEYEAILRQTTIEPPRKRPGRKTTIERDLKLRDEYEQGLNDGRWKTLAAFARHKDMNRTTLRHAINRAEKHDKRKKA